jgi:type II secretory pathway pseudopilin PulG
MNKEPKKFKKVYISKKSGFSILEVVLAAAVLTIGLVAVIGLISSSMKSSMTSRDQAVATELMQEGIELVRNVRDNNQAQIFTERAVTGSSTKNVFDYINNGSDCRIDKDFSYGLGNDIECSGNYNLNLSSSFYIHGAGSATKFSRRIKIEDFNSGKGRKITSIVTWDGGNTPNQDVNLCTTASKCIWASTILTDRTI